MADKPKRISRAELEQKIVALSWKDDAFRKAFLADPKKQFEEKLGTKLPPGLKITAHAEDENHLYFVIPKKPMRPGELADEELAKVSGGTQPLPSVTISPMVQSVLETGPGQAVTSVVVLTASLTKEATGW